MAFSTPQVYMDELAEPLCRRLEVEPTAYDLAIATCIILYHFVDVVAHVRGGKAHEVADEIAEKVPDFDTVRAIANAGKHVELTHHPKSELIGLRAEHMVRGKGAAFSDGSYFADNVTCSDMPESVVVETPDGRLHDVPHLCARVFKDLCAVTEFFQV